MRTLLLTSLAAAVLTPWQGATLKVGDKIPESRLNEIVWGWDGSESIHDYLGEPVLVDFWGKN
jgi:hypothetical protein